MKLKFPPNLTTFVDSTGVHYSRSGSDEVEVDSRRGHTILEMTRAGFTPIVEVVTEVVEAAKEKKEAEKPVLVEPTKKTTGKAKDSTQEKQP